MRRTGLALALAALAASTAAHAGGEIKPGAYCPLPKKGEVPRCLAPAQAEYASFFTALDDPHATEEELDAGLGPVEQEMARGAGGERAYLALSSLTYGYYRLAQRTAATSHADPALLARLERWNELLARAYAGSADDPAYRSALHQAASEIDERVDVELRCLDAAGEAVPCDSTAQVLRGFNEASGRVGIRGALENVLGRFFGGGS